jgi:hypothetical protein
MELDGGVAWAWYENGDSYDVRMGVMEIHRGVVDEDHT